MSTYAMNHVLLFDERGAVRALIPNLASPQVAEVLALIARCKPFTFGLSVINPLDARRVEVRETDASTTELLAAARAARRQMPTNDINSGASDEVLAALLGRVVTGHQTIQPLDAAAQCSSAAGVFLVHGHAELAVRTLERMLVQDYGVPTRILKEEPGGSLTLIEKFEAAASEVGYAIVLLTADDLVRKNDEEYWQPRPNVLFELGWFCARRGRHRVCLIAQRGLRMLSDVGGIMCYEYQSDVTECALQLWRELNQAGLIT